jgi:hypothetical protein
LNVLEFGWGIRHLIVLLTAVRSFSSLIGAWKAVFLETLVMLSPPFVLRAGLFTWLRAFPSLVGPRKTVCLELVVLAATLFVFHALPDCFPADVLAAFFVPYYTAQELPTGYASHSSWCHCVPEDTDAAEKRSPPDGAALARVTHHTGSQIGSG